MTWKRNANMNISKQQTEKKYSSAENDEVKA